MRFMIVVKADPRFEAGEMPSAKVLEDMGRISGEMAKAGVLLGMEGLRRSALGMRIKKVGDKHVVTDGPFTETKELLAGFWMIEVPSPEEALAWVKRIPMQEGQELDLRQVSEVEDFPEMSQKAADAERKWRAGYPKS